LPIASGVSFNDFLVGCRKFPRWGVPFILGVVNDRLQNDLLDFWASPAGQDCYVELPRGHGKTSILAGQHAWDIGNDPSIRIKHISSNADEACKTVVMVKRIMESDEYRAVFPEIVPDKAIWGSEAISVVRTGAAAKLRDPCLEGVSIFGRAGGRSDKLTFDDICDMRNSIIQPALREQVKDAVRTVWLPTRDFSRAQIRGKPPQTIRIGTPYHVSDVTALWRERHGANGTLFRRPVVDFRSPWPEVYDERTMRELREEYGPVAYARAFELMPISNDQLVFMPEWLDRSFYEELPPIVKAANDVVAAIDMAYGEAKGVAKRNSRKDWSVILVGHRYAGTLWVGRMHRVQTSFPEFARLLYRCVSEHGIRHVAVEMTGGQRGLAQQLRQDIPHCSFIEMTRPGDKVHRAHERQAFVEQGRFRIRAENGQPIRELQPLYDEMTTFPAGDNDDCVDAAVDLIGLASGGFGSSSRPALVSTGKPRLWRLYGN
jgi:predicted phage terminase large subunit-like protein